MDENSGVVRQKWFQYISVEPSMFLYMFAFQLTTVIEQELFFVKTCLSNLNYTHEICDNLNLDKNKDFKTNVHVSERYSDLQKIEFLVFKTMNYS